VQAGLLPLGSAMIEILHVDTEGSRELYRGCQLNAEEKARAQSLLKSHFKSCCSSQGGVLRDWAGDGGFAFFLSQEKFGHSIQAGQDFLKGLASNNAQTALALNLDSFFRDVRIKIHRGEIFLTGDATLDSADAEAFDDFIKFEKRFAPVTNELFITKSLYSAIGNNEKKSFEAYSNVKAGAIDTELFRLKMTPKVERTHDIFKVGDEITSIKEREWNYLKSQIITQKQNIAARNSITKGLIQLVNENGGKNTLISGDSLLELTLDALYNYLRVSFPRQTFRISYWTCSNLKKPEFLTMNGFRYPTGEGPSENNRVVRVKDFQYQVCKAFVRKEALAVPSVVAARKSGEWVDFDQSQRRKCRRLASSLQIPVFYWDECDEKVMLGVLCLDSDKPDMFLSEEIDLWKDDMVGFLINIALSDRLRCFGS
jgi:hypothetical protein